MVHCESRCFHCKRGHRFVLFSYCDRVQLYDFGGRRGVGMQFCICIFSQPGVSRGVTLTGLVSDGAGKDSAGRRQ